MTSTGPRPNATPTQTGYEAWADKPERPRLSFSAVAALIFSFTCLLGPLAIMLGVASLFSIQRSQGRRYGRPVAFLAIVLGIFGSAVLVFGAVGAQQVIASALGPTHRFMAAVEGGDFATAQAMHAQAAAAVTAGSVSPVSVERLAAFRDEYRALAGSYRGTPRSLLTIFSDYSGERAWAEAAVTKAGVGGSGGAVIPIRADFDTTVAIVISTPSRDIEVMQDLLPLELAVVTDAGVARLAPAPGNAPQPKP